LSRAYRGEIAMRSALSLFILLFSALFVSASVEAACGGGGYHPSTSKPAAMTQPVRSQSSESYNVAYRQTMPLIDMRQFDATSQNLRLSDEQRARIARIKQEVANRAEALRTDVDRAQANVDRCVGSCYLEKNRLDDAKARLHDFENRDFSQRLSGILSEQQKRMFYDNASAR